MREENEKWIKKSMSDLSLFEVAKYLRDRHLDAWLQNPTQESKEFTLKILSALFEGIASPQNQDLTLLLRGAQTFMDEFLRK